MRHSKSFTLIELLVVVAIIAVLVAILLPALSKSRAMTKAVVCGSNLRCIGQALGLYTNDYKGVLPPGFGHSKTGPDGPWEKGAYWISCLGPYVVTSRNIVYIRDAVFICPATGLEKGSAYAMPRMLSTCAIWGPDNWRNIDSIERTSDTVFALDFYPYIPVVDWWIPIPGEPISDETNRRVLLHGYTDNFVFVDGHVEALKEGEELKGRYVALYR